MRIITKLLGYSATILFAASQVFMFLGADSVESPSTRPWMLAGMICLAASVVLFIAWWLCFRAQP